MFQQFSKYLFLITCATLHTLQPTSAYERGKDPILDNLVKKGDLVPPKKKQKSPPKPTQQRTQRPVSNAQPAAATQTSEDDFDFDALADDVALTAEEDAADTSKKIEVYSVDEVAEKLDWKGWSLIGVFGVGMLINLIAGILFLIAAFRVHVGWGLGSMFVPFVSLVFLIMHWKVAYKSFFLSLFSILLIGGSIAGLAFTSYDAFYPPEQASQTPAEEENAEKIN